MKIEITPKTANTNKKLCSIKRDNFSCNGSWILVGENDVNISNQFNGKERTGHVVMSKKVFERLIKFYETGK